MIRKYLNCKKILKNIKQMFAFSEHLCYNDYGKGLFSKISCKKQEKRMDYEANHPYSAKNI